MFSLQFIKQYFAADKFLDTDIITNTLCKQYQSFNKTYNIDFSSFCLYKKLDKKLTSNNLFLLLSTEHKAIVNYSLLTKKQKFKFITDKNFVALTDLLFFIDQNDKKFIHELINHTDIPLYKLYYPDDETKMLLLEKDLENVRHLINLKHNHLDYLLYHSNHKILKYCSICDEEIVKLLRYTDDKSFLKEWHLLQRIIDRKLQLSSVKQNISLIRLILDPTKETIKYVLGRDFTLIRYLSPETIRENIKTILHIFYISKDSFAIRYFVHLLTDVDILDILREKPFLIVYIQDHPHFSTFLEYVIKNINWSATFLKYIKYIPDELQLYAYEKHDFLISYILNPCEELIEHISISKFIENHINELQFLSYKFFNENDFIKLKLQGIGE